MADPSVPVRHVMGPDGQPVPLQAQPLSHRERIAAHGPSQQDPTLLLIDVLAEMQAQTALLRDMRELLALAQAKDTRRK